MKTVEAVIGSILIALVTAGGSGKIH